MLLISADEQVLQIRCTAKALKQFGIPSRETCEVKPADSLLGNWYCNLLTIDRRKCVLFMNENTFLSFLLFGVRKDNSNSIPHIFANGLSQLLTLEGFSETQIERIFADYTSCEITKTEGRSALGNLRDLMINYEHSIMYDGGLKECDLGNIIFKMNRMPQRNIGWKYSIDIVRMLVEADSRPET